jgi:hypothetical protein
MAAHGARVLVVERELRFKDRVRGEWMSPWGVVEAQKGRNLPSSSREMRTSTLLS